MKGATTSTPPPALGRTLPIKGREGGDVGARASVANERAKTLRRNLTDAEAKLWVHLKRIRTVDTHFRKQVPFGSYIADFACMRGRLIVEVDGAQHGFDSGARHDVKRTRFLESEGFRVLRFWDDDVLRDIEGVLDTIYAVLHGGSNAPVRSMSKRRAYQDEAPSSPSMGEVASDSEPEGVQASRITPPGPSGHPPHRGEGAPAEPASTVMQRGN